MRINKSLIAYTPTTGAGSGSVTSVALTAPTGFTVSGSPITTSGTLALSFTTGYGIPPLMTGNSGRFLTTNGTTMSWVNIAGTDVTGAALTEVDDTNVTMTLGGTPSTALLRSVSMTLGWAGQLAVSRGGTGAATLTGVVIGNGTSAMTAITGGPNQILRVNAGATAYEFFTASFLTNPMTLNYDMIYQDAGVPTRLPSNITTTKQYLTSIGNNTATTSLAWASFTNADVPGDALTRVNDTNVQLTLGGTPATSVLRAVSLTMGWSGQLAVGRGGTGASTLTGVLIGNGTSAVTAVVGTAGQFLRRNTANTAYEFRTLQGGDIAGSELTKTDDTNVTLSLGGTPASALLQPVSITLGWTGQLSVSRGGTGASTLTGVLIGNGTSAVTAVSGTSGQLLRRNVANTAYEFFTASLLSGSGVANYVPIWTSATNIIDSPLSIVGSEANFGSNKLVAGNVSATLGSIMLQDNYSNGHFGNVGTMYSGGNLMMGYGVSPSTSSATGFLSSVFITGTPLPRSAIVAGEDIFFYTASAQSIAIGSAVSMSERLKVFNNGQLKLAAYTSTSSFTGIVQGYLAFTSGGNIITTATPGGVSGTQNYLAKFDSTGIAVGNSRIVDDGTNFLLNGATSVVTGLNLVGGISATESTGAATILRRSAVPNSADPLGIIDGWGITTGSTYVWGGGIEIRASQNWNSTSAGTEIAVALAPDNTTTANDMFVFQSNGSIRFIGRTSNPLGVAAGTMYYNTSANNMRYYNGTSWITF